MKFYIATTLTNAPKHNELRDRLRKLGHELTYDWSSHGAVWMEGKARCAEVAHAEKEGVLAADILVLLWPGLKGSHTEFGIAYGNGIPILVVGEEEFIHEPGPESCAFWFDDLLVTRLKTFDDVVAKFNDMEEGKKELAKLLTQAKEQGMTKEEVLSAAFPKALAPKMGLVSPDAIADKGSMLPADHLGLDEPSQSDKGPVDETIDTLIEDGSLESGVERRDGSNQQDLEAADLQETIDPRDGDGVERIRKERNRQLTILGYDAEHDSEHTNEELAWAAVCYAAPGEILTEMELDDGRSAWTDPWPWNPSTDPRELEMGQRIASLTKAGALIAAEIDRLIPLTPQEVTDPADEIDPEKMNALARSVERSDGSGPPSPPNPLPTELVQMLIRTFKAAPFFQSPAIAEALGTEDPELIMQVIDAMLEEGIWETVLAYEDPKKKGGLMLARTIGGQVMDAYGRPLEDERQILFFRATN